MTETVTRPLQIIINLCLRRIEAMWWPDRISNEELEKETDQPHFNIEIRIHKGKWIGHTLRKTDGAMEKDALQWNP